MQVYFLDNEEFFKRKFVFKDAEGKPFDDNQERTVFFCKGVLETVKKFGWPPDIIHCHGPMTALLPLFKKKVYHNDPIFEDTKMVYSVYDNDLDSSFGEKFMEIAMINDLEEDDVAPYMTDGKVNLNNGGIHYSDALIDGSTSLPDNVKSKMDASDAAKLGYAPVEEQLPAIVSYYEELIPDDEEVEEA